MKRLNYNEIFLSIPVKKSSLSWVELRLEKDRRERERNKMLSITSFIHVCSRIINKFEKFVSVN